MQVEGIDSLYFSIRSLTSDHHVVLKPSWYRNTSLPHFTTKASWAGHFSGFFLIFNLSGLYIERSGFELGSDIGLYLYGVASRLKFEFGNRPCQPLQACHPDTLFSHMLSLEPFPLPFSLLLPLFSSMCMFFWLWCSLNGYMTLPFQTENIGRTVKNDVWNKRGSLLSHIWGNLWSTLLTGKRLATFPDESKIFQWLSWYCILLVFEISLLSIFFFFPCKHKEESWAEIKWPLSGYASTRTWGGGGLYVNLLIRF